MCAAGSLIDGKTYAVSAAGKVLTVPVPGVPEMAGRFVPVWEAAAKASSPWAFSLASRACSASVPSPSKPVTGNVSPC